MLTVISYIALRYFFGDDWSGLLLILPLLADFRLGEIIDAWVSKRLGK